MSSEPNLRPVRCELMFAALILRLWVGMRLFFAGLDKFYVQSEGRYSIEAYKAKMQVIADNQALHSPIPQQLADLYAFPLGYLLMAVGFFVIIGLFRQLSLLAAGFMFLSLGFGLALLADDNDVVRIGISVAITAFALMLTWHDRISVDGLFFRRGRCCAATPSGDVVKTNDKAESDA